MSEQVKYFDNQNLVDRINKMPSNLIRASDDTETAICVYFNDAWVLSIPKKAHSIFEVQVVDDDNFQYIPNLELQEIESSVGLWLTTPLEHRKRVTPKYWLRSPKFFQGEPMYVKTISLSCEHEPKFEVEFTTDKDLAAEFSEKGLESLKFCYPMIGASLDDMKEQVE